MLKEKSQSQNGLLMCEETHLLGKRFRMAHIFINPHQIVSRYFRFHLRNTIECERQKHKS